MLFSSSIFLFLFLSAVLFCYYVPFRGHRQGQNGLLLIASLLFYAFGEPWFVVVMMLSITINWLLGLWVGRLKASGRSVKPAVICTAVFNLSVLFVFKYLVFTLTNLNLLGLQFMIPMIELPIGISFFTFQAMSYVLDVARGKAEVQPALYKVGLYVSLFPQLIAGPIVKYETVADEIDNRHETWSDFSGGVSRFLVGLGKKVLLSNQLAIVADQAFGLGGEAITVPFAWLGAICYTLQIYYDFSGYSDMAIGLGRMFGFHFLENFNYPYLSTSIAEFWRRWHISLSTWFRDYVYFPLGGSRVSGGKHLRNLFVVWLLTGIWHGANWTFLCWGLFYFALLAAEKFLHLGQGWPRWCRWAFTLLAVNFGWVLFRAESLGAAGRYLGAMVGLGGAPGAEGAALYLREFAPVLLLAILCVAPVAAWIRDKLAKGRRGRLLILWDVGGAVCLLAIFVLSLCFIIKGTYNPFIYFNF